MRRTRWCLKGSIRALNMAVNITGVGMIIYSLWLLKMWDQGIAQLPASSLSLLPKPWFILTCLAVGMVVCLSTVCGYMAINRTKHFILYIYIASIGSLVLLQGAVIIVIFFTMDLQSVICELIDDNHAKFRHFFIFHLHMCRFVTISVLVAQVSLVILAVILCVVRADPVNPSQSQLLASVPDFRYSFLIPQNPNVNDNDTNLISFEEVVASRTTRCKLLQFLFG